MAVGHLPQVHQGGTASGACPIAAAGGANAAAAAAAATVAAAVARRCAAGGAAGATQAVPRGGHAGPPQREVVLVARGAVPRASRRRFRGQRLADARFRSHHIEIERLGSVQQCSFESHLTQGSAAALWFHRDALAEGGPHIPARRPHPITSLAANINLRYDP